VQGRELALGGRLLRQMVLRQGLLVPARVSVKVAQAGQRIGERAVVGHITSLGERLLEARLRLPVLPEVVIHHAEVLQGERQVAWVADPAPVQKRLMIQPARLCQVSLGHLCGAHVQRNVRGVHLVRGGTGAVECRAQFFEPLCVLAKHAVTDADLSGRLDGREGIATSRDAQRLFARGDGLLQATAIPLDHRDLRQRTGFANGVLTLGTRRPAPCQQVERRVQFARFGVYLGAKEHERWVAPEDVRRQRVDPALQPVPFAAGKGGIGNHGQRLCGLFPGPCLHIGRNCCWPVTPMGHQARLAKTQGAVAFGVIALELGYQELPKEIVVAVPGALRVEGLGEQAGISEVAQHARGVGGAEQRIAQGGAHLTVQRAAQEETLCLFRLPRQYLGGHIVEHAGAGPADLDDLPDRAAALRLRCQQDPRNPAARPLCKSGHLVRGQVAVTQERQHLLRLRRRKAQILHAEANNLLSGGEAGQG